MNDPRLNSVHLDFPRREDFRRARGALLDARGMHTLAAEQERLPAPPAGSHTMIQGSAEDEPANSQHWLLDQGAVYPLRTGVNTIGRLPDNDVVIQGPYVSRRHCAILVHAGDGCEVYDIASKNGTYINGSRLSGPTHLRPGDEIRMCDRQFIFMSKQPLAGESGHESTKVE
jgi:FHA domain